MAVERSFACANATPRSFTVNGLTLRALEWGDAGRPVVLFLHGGSAHKHWFDEVAPRFADRFRAVSLDQRGHGESDWPANAAGGTPYATPNFVSDLIGVIDALGAEKTVVCGHSMGGHNAMALAAWHPERVRALVVADSRPSIPSDRLDVMHRRGHRGPRRHTTAELAVRSFRLLPPDTLAEPALLDHLARMGIAERDGTFVYRFDPAANGMRRPTDLWPLLERISAPTLLVRAARSPVLPQRMADEMLERIPRARLEVIPDAYHHLVLDRPDAVVAALESFLRQIDG